MSDVTPGEQAIYAVFAIIILAGLIMGLYYGLRKKPTCRFSQLTHLIVGLLAPFIEFILGLMEFHAKC
jgi:VIT1/CCC1 family predicted Fe2+/Mn2+ transporter